MAARRRRGNFGTKEVRALFRALELRNEGCVITTTGGGHARVVAKGLPPVIISNGKGDPFGLSNAMKELRKKGYKL